MGKYLTTLYSETTKTESFFDETKTVKKMKLTKRAHTFKNYALSYNAEILTSFNPKLQHKNIEFAIKNLIESIERL